MSTCPPPTPEQREAVLRELVVELAGETRGLRQLVGVLGQGRDGQEEQMLELVERVIGKALEGWKPNGREARVASRLKAELRLEIRRHFAG